MFKEVLSVVERGEVVYIRDVSTMAVAFQPDVELSESAEFYITKTWGSNATRNNTLFVGVQDSVYKGDVILFKFLRFL